LLWHDHSRFCLPVLTQSLDEATDLRILVCGDRKLLELERVQREKLAPEVLQGTELRGQAETMYFGANLYGLPGADIEIVQTLQNILEIGKERPLKTAFEHLLDDVLKEWHQHGQMVEEKHDLMSLYRQWAGLTDDEVLRTRLEHRLDALIQSVRILGAIEIKREHQLITFHFPHQPPRNFPDPITTVYTHLAQYEAPVVCRISPGKLKAENILVDSEQRTWLTDFASAGQAPQWWDFVCLEAVIRFDASMAPDLLAWQEFEESLMKPSQLDERLEQNDVIPELRTNIVLIEQIRRHAVSEVGLDLIPYYAGLLVWVVEAISHYDPDLLSTKADRLRDAHLLLAASMIAERLGSGSTVINNFPIGSQLHLDEEDRVWIGDQYITAFSGLRLKLLRCLYEQAGQAVSSHTIVEKVYGEKYDPMDRDQNQRIRQEISRLRDAIEPKPSHPRYILTVREKGYRLQISGEPEK
jgi:DNA-binding winged helix-turn-helix (wHTH) protein